MKFFDLGSAPERSRHERCRSGKLNAPIRGIVNQLIRANRNHHYLFRSKKVTAR